MSYIGQRTTTKSGLINVLKLNKYTGTAWKWFCSGVYCAFIRGVFRLMAVHYFCKKALIA